jgi:2-oxoglutarate dehydrogenase E1 component
MNQPTFANRWNADLIDAQYALWLDQPHSVDPLWRAFFEGFTLADGRASGAPSASGDGPATGTASEQAAIIQSRVTGAIYAYRSIGHTQAAFNPLLKQPPHNPRLDMERLGFGGVNLDDTYWTGNYLDGQRLSIRTLLANLQATYCGPIGVEYLHIQDTPRRRWLQAYMEPRLNRPELPAGKRVRVLDRVLKAEQFEQFLHTNYVGQKRFGLEGGETIIAALDALVEQGPGHGVSEYLLGMAHRGRLNVLANVLRKDFSYIFHEFSENFLPDTRHGDGDVKYHLGYDAQLTNSAGEALTMRLAANPSHLEAVNPVVEGRARARQRILDDMEQRTRVVPILIHGDAAFAGQGIVAEVLNFSQLPGYRTGGTLHFIINNQIGFTTDPSEARSTLYCTDVAKMIEAPIFHVNGDDPDAMVYVTELALAYRQAFGSDVVIDMYCYRRHGHNEADEPAFTQPTLYRQIKDHPIVSEVYGKRLQAEGVVTAEQVQAMRERRARDLQQSMADLKQRSADGAANGNPFAGSTAVVQPPFSFEPVASHVDSGRLSRVAEALTRFPADFNINPKIRRQLETKLRAFREDSGVDWAFAEALAWGTLMLDGYHVRLSGQDCVRGTFSQRHAIFYDSETRAKYIPLMEMEGRKGMLCVHNSLLSEAAVLGFDYGYSLDYPNMLCMWEAQFGDFANGAQVIIDQFLCSSESKWQRISGLVLLLPHGYEGQGPEHSSARLERYLQLCAENNIQVVNPTTPAQFFHVLRRQMLRPFRKPLIVMSPKSLLRHRDAVSPVDHFVAQGFQEMIDDPSPPVTAQRVVLCCGKVYYDLVDYRAEQQVADTVLIRVEQLYPFHHERMAALAARYADCADLVWCQEEPRNMGAWSFIAPLLEQHWGRAPRYAGRKASASTAVGSLAVHRREQALIMRTAFGVGA